MAVYLGENEVGFNTTYGGIVPSGTYNITENGTYDVTNYESAAVNVVNAGGSVSDAIKFIDYDGTILHSYSVSDFMALSAMPANPTHLGLTSQGWNWSLADAKAYMTNYPNAVLTIGQMYITESGDTEIDVKFVSSVRLSPYLRFAVNGTATVDWGDNSVLDTVTGTSLFTRKNIQHTYSAIGEYTIKIHVTSGSISMYGSSSYFLLHANKTNMSSNVVYSNCVQSVRFGNGITSIGNYAFYDCYSLTSVTIPDGVTSIGSNTFGGCYSLTSVTIPDGVTLIEDSVFNACYSLTSVAIPDGVTSIGSYAFTNCSVLPSVTIPDGVTSIGSYAFNSCATFTSATIPDGVTSIGSYAFNSCRALASVIIPDGVTSISDYIFSTCQSFTSVTIPDGVTSIGNNAFNSCFSLASVTIPDGVTSIGNSAFSACFSLASVTIPDGVTSIGNSAFSNCYGVGEYHILPTTVPTLGTTAFNNIQSDCKIYVPAASLTAYQEATNWSTYASYMVGE